MSGFAERTGVDTLANGFDWSSVSEVVEVGGGWGEVSLALAQRFGHINFTVQDLKHVINGRPYCESKNLRDRVRYVEHDFFSPQDAKSADVYYFRYIFHNYPDETCVKLLQAQIPGMISDYFRDPCLQRLMRTETWIPHLDPRCGHSGATQRAARLQREISTVTIYIPKKS